MSGWIRSTVQAQQQRLWLLRPWLWSSVPRSALLSLLQRLSPKPVSAPKPILSADNLFVRDCALHAPKLSAKSVLLEGSASISGAVTADRVEVRSNTLNLLEEASCGSVNAKEVVSNGRFVVWSDLQVDDVKSEGSLRVLGALRAKRVQAEGTVIATGELAVSESFELVLTPGSLSEVQSIISAADVSIEAKDEPKDVSAEEKSEGFLQRMMKPRPGKLTAGLIKGKNIHVENCRVLTIRGIDIDIGAGVNAVTVDFKGKVNVDKTAVVQHFVDSSLTPDPEAFFSEMKK